MIRVSIASTENRLKGVAQALQLIDSDILIPDRPVMVKPNFVTTMNQLAATHVDATRATLEYLSGKGVNEFVIAVGPALGTPDSGFDNYSYRDLANDYKIRMLRMSMN